MRINISQKISLLSIFLVILTAGAVAFAFYKSSSNTMIDHAMDDLSEHVTREGKRFQHSIADLTHDIDFIVNMPPIQGIIRAKNSGGFDKAGDSTQAQWERRLASIFSTLLHAHPDYMQARFIDAKGYEILRVERDQTGQIIRTLEKDLQYKGDHAYVTKTLQLQKNQMYLSEINLNREHGKVMVPHTPVIRAATPIYSESGKLSGLVIINLDLTHEFKHLHRHHHKLGHTLYITNDRGDFLIHPDDSKRFGFDLGNKHRLQDEFPQLSRIYKEENNENKLVEKINTDNMDIASVFIKFTLSAEEQHRYIVMGMTLPYQDITAAQTSALSNAVWLSLALIVTGIILAYAVSLKVVSPIKQISSGITNFMQGDTNQELPVKNNDEVGVLARAFENLIEQVTNNRNTLEHMNQSLEKKVAMRTRELSRFKTTLDMINDSVFIFDPDTLRFIYVNQGAADLMGYSRDELLKITPVDLQTAFDKKDFLDVIAPLKQGKESHISYQTMHITKTGKEIPVELFIQYVKPPGEKSRFVIILHDITLRREIEENIILAKEMAEKANKTKSEFLARMSHELRTPMNAILGFGQLMKDDDDIPLDETHKMYNEEIMKASYHLLDLINEVLDLARIESGRIELETELFNCHEVTQECLSLIKPLASEKEIVVEYEEQEGAHIVIDNDKKRLREILINLLSNAVKYNRPQGKITLAIEKTPENHVRFSVTDTGEGLNKEQQEHLFNPFDRIGAEHSNVEGTGIGLVIVKRLVETMGGTLGFESTPEVGSTFWVEFELANETDLNDQQTVDTNIQQLYPGGINKKINILYVEDNKANMQLVEHALKRFKNIRVLTATTPNEGLLKAAREKPEIILLDINLPEMDGYEILKLLRSNNETGNIPVIAVSAYSSEHDLEKGKQAGFDDYLTKPLELRQLYNTINRFVPEQPEKENKIS